MLALMPPAAVGSLTLYLLQVRRDGSRDDVFLGGDAKGRRNLEIIQLCFGDGARIPDVPRHASGVVAIERRDAGRFSGRRVRDDIQGAVDLLRAQEAVFFVMQSQ
jgi:hypothetical protein